MRLIVGVDSGNTSAIAALTMRGEIVILKSKKRCGISWMIDEIMRVGKPVIVTCDKAKGNETARKLAALFGARLVLPQVNLSRKRKRRLLAKFHEVASNSHERDALASAIFAYKKYRNLFSRIDKLVPSELADVIKEMLIKGEAINIKHALRSLISYEGEIKRSQKKKAVKISQVPNPT